MTDEERLDLCRRSYAAFSAQDIEMIEGMYHPDFEWHLGDMGLAVGTPVFAGASGLRDFMRLLTDEFGGFHTDIVEARGHGEQLLLRSRMRARPLQGETTVEQRLAQVIEFRDGLFWRVFQTDDPPPGWDEGRPLPVEN